MLSSSKFSADVNGETDDDDKSVTMSTMSRHNAGAVSKLTRKMKPWRARVDSPNPSEILREKVMEPTLEPTYRLEPYQFFDYAKAKRVVEDTVNKCLRRFKYPTEGNFADASNMALKLPDKIVQKVKSLNYDRYKIVCFVTLGNTDDQCLSIASRCLWDNEFDTSATYTYRRENFYCNVIVFGIYQE